MKYSNITFICAGYFGIVWYAMVIVSFFRDTSLDSTIIVIHAYATVVLVLFTGFLGYIEQKLPKGDKDLALNK